MSDEELLEIKSELSEEELNNVLKSNFTFIMPPKGQITVTVAEIEEALKTNELEKIMLDKNIDDSCRSNLISEQLSKYLAYRLGMPTEIIHGANSLEEARQIVQQAMNNYLDEYLIYDTPIGKLCIQRRDVPLLNKCYINAALVMIYLIVFNWFHNWCIGNTFMFYVGTFLNVLTMWNMFGLTFRVWGMSFK